MKTCLLFIGLKRTKKHYDTNNKKRYMRMIQDKFALKLCSLRKKELGFLLRILSSLTQPNNEVGFGAVVLVLTI